MRYVHTGARKYNSFRVFINACNSIYSLRIEEIYAQKVLAIYVATDASYVHLLI